MMGKLSVVIPCYNAQKTLDKCIQSILQCTYPELEIILIDDGSKDSTRNIIECYAEKYENVIAFSKNNEGLGKTRNYGIDKATGEYITFIDSDDYIHPDGYLNMISKLEKDGSDVVYCGFCRVYGEKLEDSICDCKQFYSKEEIGEYIRYVLRLEPSFSGISACSAVYRTEKVKHMPHWFLEEKKYLSEDKVFNMVFLQNANGISVVPESYYYYVQHTGGTITSSFKWYKFEAAYNMYVYLLEILNNSDIEQYVKIDYIVNISACLNQLFMDKAYSNTQRRQICRKFVTSENLTAPIDSIEVKKLSKKFRLLRTLIMKRKAVALWGLFWINSYIR